MKQRLGFGILILAAAALAGAVCLPRPALRPMHCDEAVHAYKLGEMIEEGIGRYRYDPLEYHGPTLNFCAYLVAKAAGVARYAELEEWHLRVVPAAFGIGLVLLVPLVADGLGRGGAALAALLTVASACMTYYSRYFIMEVLLVFFTFLAVAAAWRYVRGGSALWAALAGVAAGLMHATKETWVLVPIAMAAALGVHAAWSRWVEGRKVVFRAHLANRRVLLAAGGVGVVVAVVLLSSFFANPRGPLDSVLTYFHGLRRAAGGSGAEAGNLHINPWYSYLRRLVWFQLSKNAPFWTEGAIVALALVGTVAGLLRRSLGGADAALVRVLGVYAFVLLGIYSLIPYKTPWCVMGALHGMILVAGVGAAVLVRSVPRAYGKAGVVLLLAGAVAHLGWQGYRTNFRFYDSPYNPWVYAHTSRDIIRLGRRAEQLAAVCPAGRRMRIHFISPDPHDQWPLPWYLRHFDRRSVGYFTSIPARPDAEMVIFPAGLWPQMEGRLRGAYEWEYRGLRPGVPLLVGVEAGLWERFVEKIRARTRPAATETAPGG